jgi:hypothetical protein
MVTRYKTTNTEKSMKAFIALVLMVSGCASDKAYEVVTHQTADNGLQLMYDEDRGVVCYVYKDGDDAAISCVKTRVPK